jgi:hypothetical protein
LSGCAGDNQDFSGKSAGKRHAELTIQGKVRMIWRSAD